MYLLLIYIQYTHSHACMYIHSCFYMLVLYLIIFMNSFISLRIVCLPACLPSFPFSRPFSLSLLVDFFFFFPTFFYCCSSTIVSIFLQLSPTSSHPTSHPDPIPFGFVFLFPCLWFYFPCLLILLIWSTYK